VIIENKKTAISKKPAFWIVIIALVTILITSAIIITNSLTSMNLPKVKVSAELDKSVSKAIMSYNKPGIYFKGIKTLAEGHIILGHIRSSENEIVYAVAACVGYGFKKGNFIVKSGSGPMPIKITLKISKNNKYSLKEYQEPLDGSENYESLKKMFPQNLVDIANQPSQSYLDSIEEQVTSYATAYLKSVGSNSKIEELFGERI
jgi:hypothetical protein